MKIRMCKYYYIPKFKSTDFKKDTNIDFDIIKPLFHCVHTMGQKSTY